jgi:hypothetical protein
MRWLDEPTEPDPTWARPGESPLSWLMRSTLPRAAAGREFLNAQLASLPAPVATALRRRFPSHWKSCLFELIVARALQELGAELDVEVQNEHGFRPDYRARFDDGLVTLEAVIPEIGRDVDDQRRLADSLEPLLAPLVPPEWSVLLYELPDVGPSESKKEIKRVFKEAMPVSSPSGKDDSREVSVSTSKGLLSFTLWPRIGDRPIIGGPIFSGGDDTEERIRHAVCKKRQQVRGETAPVVLAVCAAGLSSQFESFDHALFGRTCSIIGLPSRREIRVEFRPDGLFMARRDGPPTYAGVLAFREVSLFCPADPVLYMHPRFAGTLPRGLLDLETRTASAADGLAVTPSCQPDFMSRIGFVDRD